MKKIKSKRRIGREKTLQVLYAVEINPDSLNELLATFYSDMESENEKEFSQNLVKIVIRYRDLIDQMIEEKASNWDLTRIALIDRILIRMGIAEIMYFEEIPPKVTINEMIDISKEFSTSKSGKFINGILDSILIELKNSKQLHKIGRGLIDTTMPKTQPSKN